MSGDASSNVNDDNDGVDKFSRFMLERSQPWNAKCDLYQYIDRAPTLCP
jgi:hypothetical protein